jgi:hypothetical protein
MTPPCALLQEHALFSVDQSTRQLHRYTFYLLQTNAGHIDMAVNTMIVPMNS